MQPEISVVVPLNDEGPNVERLVQGIVHALQSLLIEIILVDDGSTDDTAEKALEAERNDSRVRLIRHPTRSGQSAALWTGFKASRGEVIATLDGDLQNDPADLPKLLERLQLCDMVCGVRIERQDTWVRRVSSRVARYARRAILRVDFRDSGCNLRVFKSSLVAIIPPFDGFHRFLPILAHNAGANVQEMPVTHRSRAAGRSKYGVRNRLLRGVVDLFMVRWLMKRRVANFSEQNKSALV